MFSVSQTRSSRSDRGWQTNPVVASVAEVCSHLHRNDNCCDQIQKKRSRTKNGIYEGSCGNRKVLHYRTYLTWDHLMASSLLNFRSCDLERLIEKASQKMRSTNKYGGGCKMTYSITFCSGQIYNQLSKP